MSRNKRLGLLLPLFLVLLATAGCSDDGKSDAELVSEELIVPEEANYTTVTVEKGEYTYERMTSGTLGYLISANLTWDKENCRYQEVLVKEGDTVAEGDVLMRFTTEESQVNLEEEKLNLTHLQQEYATNSSDKQKEIETARSALSSLSLYDYQIAKLRLNQQQASYQQYCCDMEYQIAQQKARIADLQEEMDRQCITAPYDGVIESVASYTLGNKVPTDTVLLSMYSTDKIAVYAENTNNAFLYNQKVTITAGSKTSPSVYEGRVVAASNILPPEARSEYMVVQIQGEKPEDLSALIQSISISGNTEDVRDVLVANKNAFVLEEGKYYVQLLEDGAIKKRFVTLGCGNNSGNGSIVWILDGLEEGDELVLAH